MGRKSSCPERERVNCRQVAILTPEAIVPRPVVLDGAIVVGYLVNLCLSFDHCILDRADAGAFIPSVNVKMEAFAPQRPLYQASDEAQSVGEAF